MHNGYHYDCYYDSSQPNCALTGRSSWTNLPDVFDCDFSDRKPSLMLFHGTRDNFIPAAGSVEKPDGYHNDYYRFGDYDAMFPFNFIGAMFSQMYGCRSSTNSERSSGGSTATCTTFTGCPAGVNVTSCSVTGAGHRIIGESQATVADYQVWRPDLTSTYINHLFSMLGPNVNSIRGSMESLDFFDNILSGEHGEEHHDDYYGSGKRMLEEVHV